MQAKLSAFGPSKLQITLYGQKVPTLLTLKKKPHFGGLIWLLQTKVHKANPSALC